MPVYVIAQGRTVNRALHDDYDSPEYQAILPMRLESAPGTLVLVEG